jgi:8-oxo-dGTP pyrophosphatase MutT (NUDIX family)
MTKEQTEAMEAAVRVYLDGPRSWGGPTRSFLEGWQARDSWQAQQPAQPPIADAAAKDLPRLVACAIIVRDGKVLLEKRAPSGVKGLDGMWDLPGGKVELGEEVALCVAREIREELGIVVNPVRLIPYLPVSDWVYPDGQRRHWILASYECELISGEPACNDRLQWFPLDALPAAMLLADRALLRVAKQPAQPVDGDLIAAMQAASKAVADKHRIGWFPCSQAVRDESSRAQALICFSAAKQAIQGVQMGETEQRLCLKAIDGLMGTNVKKPEERVTVIGGRVMLDGKPDAFFSDRSRPDYKNYDVAARRYAAGLRAELAAEAERHD